MKRIVTLLSALAIVGLAVVSLAQVNPRGTASLEGGAVTIEYGRPSAKGRDVMSMIEPGSTWRMGADNSTTLTSTKDLEFGGTKVSKGTYTLTAYFAEKEKWNLVLSKDGNKVAEAPGRFEKDQPLVEQMTIALKQESGKATLVLTWGSYRLSADFKIV
jgi:hypothetical protein